LLLERRSAGLAEPERLRLEEHLAGCPACRHDADLLRSLSRLSHTAETELAAERRLLLLQQALRTPLPQPGSGVSVRGWLVGAPIAALCALALVLGWLRLGAPTEGASKSLAAHAASTPNAAAAANGGEPASRLLSGELAVNGSVLPAGGSVPSDLPLTAANEVRLDTGRARLQLGAGTRIVWRKAQATVQLESGEVLAEVSKDRSHEFRVSTRDFVVVVTGTRFAVNTESVRVSEGSVRVTDGAGQVLAEAVRAGQSWQRNPLQPQSAPHATSEAPATPARMPVQATGEAPVTGTVAARQPHALATTSRAPEQPREPASALLDRARDLLAAGQAKPALAPIAQALALHLARGVRAEAMSLRAEAALVAGEYEAAAQRYLEVAEAYRDLPAGENALFAAARLRLAHTGRAQARELFTRYLARYPHGRFRREADASATQLETR
jgi:ferric-dicitrate binding protein FerR (iron transport regulator)